MKAYASVGFTGVMQPDHTPAVTLPPGSEGAVWHVGTAFAVGYMKAAARGEDRHHSSIPRHISHGLRVSFSRRGTV